MQLTLVLTMTVLDKIKIQSNDVNTTNFHPVAGNKYSTLLCHKEVNDGLGITSMVGLKTFVQYVDGHLCTFAQVR